jgi:hypothetical protein
LFRKPADIPGLSRTEETNSTVSELSRNTVLRVGEEAENSKQYFPIGTRRPLNENMSDDLGNKQINELLTPVTEVTTA